MTVVLVCFLHDKPWDSLVQRCSVLAKAREEALKGEEEQQQTRTEEDTRSIIGPESGAPSLYVNGTQDKEEEEEEEE